LSKRYVYEPLKKIPVVVKSYLLSLMVDNKIERITIYFNGGGDDGCVQDAEIFPENIQAVGGDLVNIPKEIWSAMSDIGQGISYNSWLYKGEPESISFPIKEIFPMVLGYWIYDTPVDWVNGEGGAGSCELIVKNNKLNIKISSHEWIQEEGPTHSCKL